MKYQKRLNAFTRKRLLELVQVENYSVKNACKIFNVSRQTYYKWIRRQNLNDLPSTPHNFYRKTPKILERIVIKMRDNLGLSSIKIHFELKNRGIINTSTNCYLSESAICAVFKRYKRGYKFDKLKRKKPVIIRYEKQNPGDMAHTDVKKIRKIKGDYNQKRYEALLLDDCTRIVYAEIIEDKTAKTLSNFLKSGVKFFKDEYNIEFKSLLSDNGPEFTTRSKKNVDLHLFEATLKSLGIVHKYTKPYHPQTNGKAERMWRTLDIEFYRKKWLFSPEHREQELTKWIEKYNKYRPHLGIKGLTPYQKFLASTSAIALESNQSCEQAKAVVNL
ncbi:MAG TPA: IS481 family transposase [Candidatus Gastranaerophilaceae bacterium]|nr:IS481 family transposase [Candidatus Gastranaerophilaceae bacterium]